MTIKANHNFGSDAYLMKVFKQNLLADICSNLIKKKYLKNSYLQHNFILYISSIFETWILLTVQMLLLTPNQYLLPV